MNEIVSVTDGSISSSSENTQLLVLNWLASFEELSIPVVQFHAESCPGQFEFALGHSGGGHGLSVDSGQRGGASDRSQAASLACQLPPQAQGGVGRVGQHVHISLWKDDVNLLRGGGRRPIRQVTASSGSWNPWKRSWNSWTRSWNSWIARETHELPEIHELHMFRTTNRFFLAPNKLCFLGSTSPS